MPRQDATGPAGAGPMTGRGMGPCGQGSAWGGRGQGWGRGMGRGAGMGAGMNAGAGRWPWWIQRSDKPADVLKDLQAERDELDQAIKGLTEKE